MWYHGALAGHFRGLIKEGLEGSEIIPMLSWLNIYKSPEMLLHSDLEVYGSRGLVIWITHLFGNLYIRTKFANSHPFHAHATVNIAVSVRGSIGSAVTKIIAIYTRFCYTT